MPTSKPVTTSPAWYRRVASCYAAYLVVKCLQGTFLFGRPFGWVMPGKKVESGYQYGFNGQERDTEWRGGHALAFKYCIHDARLGKFLSVDPLAAEYPWNSAYAYPITFSVVENKM